MYHWLKSLENKHEDEDEDEEEEIMKEIIKEDEDEDEEIMKEIIKEDEEDKPSTSKKKTTIININKDIDDDYKTFLDVKDLPLPSKIIEENMNLNELIIKTKDKINYSENYIKEKTTKHGKLRKKLSKIQIDTYARHKKKITIPKRLYGQITKYQKCPKIYR